MQEYRYSHWIYIFHNIYNWVRKRSIIEEFFHKKIEEMHVGEENYLYTLVHTELNAVHENDGLALFIEENKHQGSDIYSLL